MNRSSPQKIRLPRQAPLPDLFYNPELPITSRKDDIVQAIRRHQVTIITGETGSGKTTQIPKMCLEAGRGRMGLIGCTQPRRIAAITVAQRLAEELHEEVGHRVAYKIRFDEMTGPRPLIKVMTDGILLAEAQSDHLLHRYDTIIVDEAHERSLNIDFVLGILKTVILKRADLKVIITSATIDTEKFSRAFNNAPIIAVSGRLYPVDLRWRPLDAELEESGEFTYIDAAIDAVAGILKEQKPGDILIFMPSEQDIWETCERLQGRYGDETTVLPLFARLPWHDQRRVFQAAARPKIIVATNVAETSITIPNIRYVIDTGLARISQYNARSRSSSLPIRPISRSSAEQRKGRCGRVRHGICIRLYSEEQYLERPLYTPPEILRSNLAGVILQMLYLNLGDIHDFPFIDLPAKKNITDAIDILQELGAIRKKDKDLTPEVTHPYALTGRGQIMARLPIDPRISRMIIEGRQRRCLDDIAIIASGLSIIDPRERPADKKTQADQMHASFIDPTSDFMTLLRIWKKFHATLESLKSQNKMRKFCHDHYLSYKRMQEWRDVYKQIAGILEEEAPGEILQEGPTQKPDDPYTAIHKSILSGYLGNIAEKKEKNRYHGTKGREPFIFPGSALFNRAGLWIVAAEMVETSRLYARTVANIDPAWIEEVGKDLCRSTYADPHWEKNREDVVASEKLTLFGLTIVPRRYVSYSRINPEEASALFIRQGLLPGDLKSRFRFLDHNLALIERIQDMENKTRRHDLIDEEAVFRFYAERLPGIANVSSLRKWIHKQGSDAFLQMCEDDVLLHDPDREALSAYPDHAVIDGVHLPLTYRFEPGQIHDGITLTIPSGILPGVSIRDLDWAVPGILRDKIYGLLKGLAKEYRKKLPPPSNLSHLMIDEMPRGKDTLMRAMGKFIHERYGVFIPLTAWSTDQLPDHLKMLMVVVDGQEQVLSISRNIRDLHQDILGGKEAKAFEEACRSWGKTGLTDWTCGDLPETVALKSNGAPMGFAYPALEIKEETVCLSLFKNRTDAQRAHENGVRRLYEIRFADDLRHLRKSLVLAGNWKEWAVVFGGVKSLEKILYEKVVVDLLATTIRTKAEFVSHGDKIRKRLLPRGQEILHLAAPVVETGYLAASALDRLEKVNSNSVIARRFLMEMRQELAHLLPSTFLQQYDENRLIHVTRYLRGLVIRTERGLLHMEKALGKADELRDYEDKLKILRDECLDLHSAEKKEAMDDLAWMIEEYKISLFAQELKTPYPISKKRLDEKIREIEMME